MSDSREDQDAFSTGYKHYSVSKAAKILNLSTNTVKAIIERGELRTIRIGAYDKIHLKELERYRQFGAWKGEDVDYDAIKSERPTGMETTDINKNDGRSLPTNDRLEGSTRSVGQRPSNVNVDPVERIDSHYPAYLRKLKK